MNINRYKNMLSNHPEMVQAVPAMPNDLMAWSGSNSLGNVVDFGPDANNRQMVLKLDEWGPPEMWTISLAIDRYIETVGVGLTFEIIAEIDIGVGGTTQRIYVDWINGTQLTVPMNAVSVTAIYEVQAGVPVANLGLDKLRLSVQIARGTRSGPYAPTKLLHFIGGAASFELHASGGQAYFLPPFTREIEVLRYHSTTNPFATAGADEYLVLGDAYLGPWAGIGMEVRRIYFNSITVDQQRFTVPYGSRVVAAVSGATHNWGPFMLNCHLEL